MTDEQARALGERWLKAAGQDLSGWRAGMLDNHGRRVLAADAFSILWTAFQFDVNPWPDLRDPATRGAALEVVRERHACHALGIVYSGTGWQDRWMVCTALPVCNPIGQGGDTEAEALVAALEAAP